MLGIAADFGNWDLMGTPRSFDRFAVDFLGAGPTFWRFQDQERPARTFVTSLFTRFALDGGDLGRDFFKGVRHAAMHGFRIVPFEQARRISVAVKKLE